MSTRASAFMNFFQGSGTGNSWWQIIPTFNTTMYVVAFL